MDELKKVAKAIKGKGKKNKWCYRLTSLCLGYSLAFAAGNFLMFNFDTAILFAGLMVGAMCVSKSLLKNMFLLDGAWNMLIDRGCDLASVIGKPYKTANMGKRLALLGTLLGGYSGVVKVVDNSGRVNHYGGVFENTVLTVAVIILTFWIPQLILLINKATAKRFATKHPDMVASYADSLQAECAGDVAKAKQLMKLGHVSGTMATSVAAAMIAVSVVGNLYAFLDVKGTVKEKMAEKEYLAQLEEEARLQEEANNVALSESEEAETEAEEEQGNPNGTGFYVTPECLEVYLAYISSGEAATDYNRWQNKRFEDWQMVSREPSHFSICGMHSGEPYLLLSSDFFEMRGDSILFAERSSTDPNSCSIVTDWEINTYCDLSDKQFLVADDLYIYNGEKEKNAKFVLHRQMVYAETEYEEDMVDFLYYDTDFAGNLNHSKNDYNVKRGVMFDELLEITWFSMDDLDAARAYYERYATPEEGADVSTETVYNRDDYYTVGTPLVYFDYIGEGRFTINEYTYDGVTTTSYKFYDLPEDFNWDKTNPHIENPYIVRDGAAASDYYDYIFENEAGELVCISVTEFHDFNEGCFVEIAYETDETIIVNKYNRQSGASCETVADVLNHLRAN